MLSWPSKDPDEVLDYRVNWAERLDDSETITTSVFTVVEGDVAISTSPVPSIAGSTTVVWLEDGTVNTKCVILNRIVTSAGRTYDQSITLRIRSH